ncbi:MAG: TonB-dependent receptor [Chitinophagaceae bacterium]|nr:MAG: TonB-dependent receptor [Chitinophagaceae bacterium]
MLKYCMLLTMLPVWLYSQELPASIEIKVIDQAGQPLENATVELVKPTDSLLVKAGISDKSGIAAFENIRTGPYLVRSSMIGFSTNYSSPFNYSSGHYSKEIVLIRSLAADMKAVVVSAKKPFIQKLNDRLVVNVESSITGAGSSALDILERAPGVTVDQNDAISLRGRSRVIIMIDGKPTPMTGAELATYLRGLPSGAIERIDIITNPSARYDAAGNSGIIDIRMKKDQRFGMNGSVTAGYGQGIYPKANTGFTFNYRNKNINLFGNYNYSFRKNLNNLLLDRNFYENGQYNGGDLKNNYSRSPISSHTPRIGVDYYISKKTVIGVVINANFNSVDRKNDNSSLVINPAGEQLSRFAAQATNDDYFRNAVANINFKHSFDSTGKELTADLDYGRYRSSSLSNNATSYFKLDQTTLQPDYILRGNQQGTLTLKTAKVDYVQPFKKEIRLEAGFKTSFVSSDNDARFFDVSDGVPKNDINKTNQFYYNENNNAAYFNVSRTYKKFNAQVGLRTEQTNVETRQAIGNIKWDSSYLQLFPSAFVNYNLANNQTVGVSVSRRIDRPGYSQLNPFLFLIDVTTYATGYPALLPQLTWSYELSYNVRAINFNVAYSRTSNPQNIAIAKFNDVFPNIPSDENVTVQIPVNLESSDYIGLTISAPVKVAAWWNMLNNANLFYIHYNGRLGSTNLNTGKPSYDLRSNNTFTIGKGWTAELTGTYNSSGQDGFMVFDPRWGVSAGIQKTILDGKGTLRVNMTDIFWTNLPKAVITYDNYVEKWRAYRETRVANITFSYRFGNNKVQAARRRTTGSEEERRRAGN